MRTPRVSRVLGATFLLTASTHFFVAAAFADEGVPQDVVVGECRHCAGPAFSGSGDGAKPGSKDDTGPPSGVTAGLSRFYNRIAFTQACPNNSPDGADDGCANSTGACAAPQLMSYRWVQRVDRRVPANTGPWLLTGQECRTPGDPVPRATPAEIYSAFKRLPMPLPQLHVQPSTRTLIGLDTVFYTEVSPKAFDDIDLKVETIDFRAKPETYIWHFGDGDQLTGSDPGHAYPDQSVTHAYTTSGVSEKPYVAVRWAGEYRRQDETTWHEVPDRVLAEGPPLEIAVMSARSELVEDPT